MEIVIVTGNKVIGLDEDLTDLSYLDYFSALPYFENSIGAISDWSFRLLVKDCQTQIRDNLIDVMSYKKRGSLFKRNGEIFLYSLKNMDPILYEVPGYNCIINFRNTEYDKLDCFKAFLFNENGFNVTDFQNLKLYTIYLIRSYHDGGAAYLYTGDEEAKTIINRFNKLCIERSGSEITIENLS